MSNRALLTVMSLTSILLFPIHVAQDVVLGLDRAGSNQVVGVLIMLVWLYAALVLNERWYGLALLLIGGILAAGLPVLHMRGRLVNSPEFPHTPGAFWFMWGLWMIGASGAMSVLLSLHEMRRLYVNRERASASGR